MKSRSRITERLFGATEGIVSGHRLEPDSLLLVGSGLLEIGQALLDVLVVRADLFLVELGFGLKFCTMFNAHNCDLDHSNAIFEMLPRASLVNVSLEGIMLRQKRANYALKYNLLQFYQ